MDAVHKIWPNTEAGAETAPPPAFDLTRPATLCTPLVFASPHSGRFYPPAMMAASVLDDAAIRRSEDAYVDGLVGQAAAQGVPLLAARYARAYIDVNREPYELDPAMFEDELPAFACARTVRVAAGLGSIPKLVAEGQEIYRRKLTFAEAKERIERVHRPYHAALRALVQEAREVWGIAILIDWHSMPSAMGQRSGRASDFVLGDRFGAACSRRLTDLWERELTAHGYRVSRNAPYAGGHTTEFYGSPGRGVHALQIEINRGLYLDEEKLHLSTGFTSLKRDLSAIFCKLAVQDWGQL
jgi:N-formylglutamate amidohydrolase